MKILGIIPARYASTRFPAKALIEIEGKTMIRRVMEQASKATLLQRVVVATDHEAIAKHVRSFGGGVIMTSLDHQSGTDRCYEALQKLEGEFNYVINIQGDEPFILPQQIDLLASTLDGTVELATLIKKIDDPAILLNPNTPKVVINTRQEALYFSRQILPYQRTHAAEPTTWPQHHAYYKHIGIYAYRTDILAQITKLPPSSLEKAEALEQLRWLENGYRIRCVCTDLDSFSIDTPEDLERVAKRFL